MAGSRFGTGTGISPFQVDTHRELLDGLEPTVHTVLPIPDGDDLKTVASEKIHPVDLETVSSYNWVYGPGQRLKIIVPGYPSCWNPPELPTRLPSDIGFRFIHQSEYFSPGAPLRPLLRAVYTHKPDFNVKEVDIITDRNSLIRLFKFVRGDTGVMLDTAPILPSTTRPAGTPSTPSAFTNAPNTPPTSPPREGSWRDRHPPSPGSGGGGGMRNRVSRGSNPGLGFRGGSTPGYGARGRGDGRYIRGVWSPNWSVATHPNKFLWVPRPVQETRIDVNLVNGTLMLSRWETHSSEMISEGEHKGWGYQFLATFTRFGEAGADNAVDGGELQSHHRIISYKMGGKKFLVCFHGDAVKEGLGELRFWAEKHRKTRKGEGGNNTEKKEGRTPGKKADDWLEKEFVEGLSKMTLNNVKTATGIEAHPTPTPLYAHESIVGIKTCNIKNKDATMSRALAQVFFSQTPHLYVGYHNRGIFDHVEKIETEAPLREWEVENDEVLRKLLVLLDKIKNVVAGIEGGKASVVFKPGGEMSVYVRRGGSEPVPEDLVAKWD